MNVKTKIQRLINKPYFFPILIALVLSTLYIGYALSSILLGVLCFFSIYYAINKKSKTKVKTQLVWPIILYLFFVLTLLWTVNIDLTIKGLGRTIALIIIPSFFFCLPKFTLHQLELVLKYYTINNTVFGLFFIVISFFRYLKLKSFLVFTYHDLVSVFNLNAIYVSIYFLISFVYLLSIKNKSKSHILLLIFFFGFILLLSSKIIVLALLIVLITYGVKKKKRIKISKKSLVILVLGVSIAIVTSKELFNRFSIEKETNLTEVFYNKKFNKVYPWTGTSIRLLQTRILIDQIKEDSIFWKGFGLFASRENLKLRHLKFNTYKGYHKYNYHNQYAQIFSETGVIGLFLLLYLLGTNFFKAIKSRNIIFITFSIAIPLLFLTESFLWVHRGVIFFTLMYCLFNNTNFIPSKNNNFN